MFGGAGRDRLLGGAGADRMHGGKGRDRLSGGGGNDTLNSVDKRKDALVSGGAGKNSCRIDPVDLAVVRGCSKIVTVPSGGPERRPRRAEVPGTAPRARSRSEAPQAFSAARSCPRATTSSAEAERTPCWARCRAVAA